MKTEKDFDCLKLKDEIQAKLRKEWQGLTDEQIRERIRHDLDTSEEPLAVWWRDVTSRRAAASAHDVTPATG